MLPEVNLARFSSRGFIRGAGPVKEALWVLVRLLLFEFCPVSLSPLKCVVLRLFGATIGRGVIIKPRVKITFPWKLTVGDHAWLGEECWLMNLAPIIIESHVCISQRAFLCTGNHDYTKTTFDLITSPIHLHRGAWVGAGAFVGPGVTMGSHAVLTAASVASKPMDPYAVYCGNPAHFVRSRAIQGDQQMLPIPGLTSANRCP